MSEVIKTPINTEELPQAQTNVPEGIILAQEEPLVAQESVKAKEREVENKEFNELLGSIALRKTLGDSGVSIPMGKSFAQRRASRKLAKKISKYDEAKEKREFIVDMYGDKKVGGKKHIASLIVKRGRKKEAKKAYREGKKTGEQDKYDYIRAKRRIGDNPVMGESDEQKKTKKNLDKAELKLSKIASKYLEPDTREAILGEINATQNQVVAPEENSPTNYPQSNHEPVEAVEPHEIDTNIDFEAKAREIHGVAQEEIKKAREVWAKVMDMDQKMLDSTFPQEEQRIYLELIAQELGMSLDEAMQKGGDYEQVARGLQSALKDIREAKTSEAQPEKEQDTGDNETETSPEENKNAELETEQSEQPRHTRRQERSVVAENDDNLDELARHWNIAVKRMAHTRRGAGSDMTLSPESIATYLAEDGVDERVAKAEAIEIHDRLIEIGFIDGKSKRVLKDSKEIERLIATSS